MSTSNFLNKLSVCSTLIEIFLLVFFLKFSENLSIYILLILYFLHISGKSSKLFILRFLYFEKSIFCESSSIIDFIKIFSFNFKYS